MFVVLTILFISSELENGIVTGKQFWFYISMVLIAFSSFCIVVIEKKKMFFRVIDILVILFIITSFLSNTPSIHDSILTKYVLIILIILLFFYFKLIFQVNKNVICLLLALFVITGLVESVWGLMQLYGYKRSQHGLFLMTGSFFNPGTYACYLAVIFPMALYYAVKYQLCYKVKFHFRNLPVYFLWGISVFTVVSSILVLPAAMSRTAWIGCVGGSGLVLLHFFY